MSVLPRFSIVAAAVAIAVPHPAFAQDAALAPVQALSDGLIDIMKGGKALGFAGRAAKIAPIVDRTFDIPLLTRLAVGSAWTAAAPADRTALIAALRRLTINRYADNFDSFTGQSFSIDQKVDTRGTDKLVRTTLSAPKASAVKIAYRLRQSGGSWRIIDVFYENSVSQLATQRADFEGILAKGGAKALIGHLNALADKAAH